MSVGATKGRLGRGLASLIGDTFEAQRMGHAGSAGEFETRMLAIELLKPSPLNTITMDPPPAARSQDSAARQHR